MIPTRTKEKKSLYMALSGRYKPAYNATIVGVSGKPASKKNRMPPVPLTLPRCLPIWSQVIAFEVSILITLCFDGKSSLYHPLNAVARKAWEHIIVPTL